MKTVRIAPKAPASRKEKPVSKARQGEEVARRQFLRQSAEVAALSLFGVMGLDAVVQRVAERIADRAGIAGVAERIVGRAYASDGLPEPDDTEGMLSAFAEGDSCPYG